MREYVTAFGMVLLYLGLYTVFGDLFLRIVKQKYILPVRTVLGFFVYYLVFYLLALPMKMTGAALSMLSHIWIAVVLLVLLVEAYFVFWKKEKEKTIQPWKQSKWYVAGYVIGILFLAAVMNVNQATGALWDESYYIGEVTTNIYNDSLVGYDAYTGEPTDEISEEYFLEMTETHSGVACHIFGVHPLIEIKTVRATAFLIVFYLLVIAIGQLLFKTPLQSELFFFFFVVLDLFSYNTHTRAQIMLYRAFEGKAVMANTILFVIFWIFLVILKDTQKKDGWILAFVMIAASFGLNMTSILLVPVMFSALIVPMILVKKEWKLIPRYIICLLPWIPEAAFYILMH